MGAVATRYDLRAPGVDLGPAFAAIAGGALAIVPTDTVYGLACAADDADAYARLLTLKGRPAGQPTAILLAAESDIWEHVAVPRIAREVTRALLPGPVTVIVVNMARQFAHLCGDEPERLGVRVPRWVDPDPARAGLAPMAALPAPLACTSANRHGSGAEVVDVADLDPQIAAGVDVILDAGPLPASEPSTVIDISRWPVGPPEILRAGALDLSDLVGTFARLPH